MREEQSSTTLDQAQRFVQTCSSACLGGGVLPGLRPHQHLQAGPLVLVGPPAGAGGSDYPGGRLTVEQWLIPKQLSAGGVWWVAGGPPSKP